MPTVLLVEDHGDLREILKYYFEEAGYCCLAVGSVRDARVAINNHGPFVAVLTDLMMPGENPVPFIEDCRAQGMPVAVLTGLDETTARSICPANVPIMTKPLDLREALTVIEGLITVQAGTMALGKHQQHTDAGA